MFNTKSAAISCTKGDVVLVQDMKTGLVYNSTFNPKLMEYNTDYQNEQAYSYVFKKHLDDVSNIISRNFLGKRLLEIGCGKGYFLEHLQVLGFDINGIDPAYEGTNPNIIKSIFSPSLRVQSDGIILRHVLEHIPNPIDFLNTIKKFIQGKIYIEVPCFNWIRQHNAWFDIYYEHVNYFCMTDFQRMFGTIHDAEYLFGGQYLAIVADIATLRIPQTTNNDLQIPTHNFLPNIKDEVLKPNTQTVVWGAASKGVIFTLILQRLGVNIDFAIDINPFKQGKYLAGSGIKIYSPMDAMQILDTNTTIFVMNPNYLDEVKQLTDNKFKYIPI